MKPDEKQKDQEKKTDKAMGNLKGKKLDSEDADQVRGGMRMSHDDESPK